MEVEKLNTIKETVKNVLTDCPKTRDSDKLLIIKVFNSLGFKLYIDDLKNCPTFESVTRARRFIQKDFKELRASQEVKEKRTQEENKYKKVFK